MYICVGWEMQRALGAGEVVETRWGVDWDA
jgi:hypothetical protein